MPSTAIAYAGVTERTANNSEAEPRSKGMPPGSQPRLLEIEALGQRCKEGDLAAWTSLFPLVWPVLVRFVNRLYHSLDEQDAEDAAQASLEAAIKGIETFSGRGLFRAWLFGIAAQQARTLYRRKGAVKRGLKLLVPMGDLPERHDDRAISPAEALAASDRLTILHRALEELSEDDRDLIHLHFFGELTFKEIGKVRNLNPKTVCTRLARCKGKLLNAVLRSNLTRADG